MKRRLKWWVVTTVDWVLEGTPLRRDVMLGGAA